MKTNKNNSVIRKKNIFGSDFIKKWLSVFAPNLTSEQYDKYVCGQYIWHIFSWEIIPKENYLKGDAARKAYNEVNKNGAKYLRLWCDEKPSVLTAQFDTAEKIETPNIDNSEFYVVGKDFAWTYIVTHETECGCGPYFMKIK